MNDTMTVPDSARTPPNRALGEREEALLRLLQRVAVAANSEDDVRPVLQHTLDDVCVLTGWPIGHAYILPESDGDMLVSTGLWHMDDPEAFVAFRCITEAMPLARGVGLPGRVLASGRALWVADVTKDANFPRARAAIDIGVRAGFGFPIMVGPRVEGVMEFFSPLAIEPDDAWLDVVQQIGYVVGRVIERRRARQALEQALAGEHLARQRAEVATRSRDEVLATVSHDLQNPLHTIVLAAALAEHQVPGPPGECLRKQMGVIRRAVERMSGLIRDLLDAALIDAGRLQIEPQAVPAHELLDEAAALMRLHADERSIALVVTAEPGLPSVQGDRGRLLQVLANLLDNAVKFTPAGGIITLQAVRRAAGIEFSVADTGPGIAPALQEHLFDRFWRAGERDKAGTGLGLAIAKGIVEAHGGQIGIDSRPGAGSRFFFTVPAA
ncbi:MAG: GAF domain-containing protein [Nannocystis sp.]|nr:GAF domain-containing sensor histidine kinase [Nannocystis sp.]MBA3545717.1 GAF domain-containing protein [Nannocystis sp.]